MPKAIQIFPKDDAATAWSAYRKASCGTTKRRLQVIALLLEGKSRKFIEAVTRYRRGSISSIILRYNNGGLSAVRNMQRENSGRPLLLNAEQRQEISQDIQREIDDKNFWNGEKLVRHVKQKYNVDISLKTAYRLFDELGYSLQTPRPTHIKGDKELQEAFKGKF